MSASPTQRCLQECRERGWLAAIVERRLGGYSHDAFGFGDILVIDHKVGSLLIQATSGSNVAARMNKIVNECAAPAAAWLRAGNRIEVWGWAKRGPRGKRKLWTLRSVPVPLVDVANALDEPYRDAIRAVAREMRL